VTHALWTFIVLALLVISAGCSDRVHKSPPTPVVNVAQDVPASLRQAVLRLHVHTPSYGNIYGSRSLSSPVGSGNLNGHFYEERLLAIRSTGFEVLLTRGLHGEMQTATLFFPYGERTVTTALGCEIIGEFK
jgi:hypothetical protein